MSRIERDVIGEVSIEDNVLYGINTRRAMENFQISGMRADSDHIISMVQIKRSAIRNTVQSILVYCRKVSSLLMSFHFTGNINPDGMTEL